jgi:hypothetical protein
MRKVIKVLDEVTATTTANPVNILGAKRVTLLCKRADHSSGSSTFTAQVGVGTDLADYKRWDSNVTHTNVQYDTSVDELVLSADGVDFLSMSPKDIFEVIQVKVTEATDGTHSAWLIIDYEDDNK